jgi:hypothetical protein
MHSGKNMNLEWRFIRCWLARVSPTTYGWVRIEILFSVAWTAWLDTYDVGQSAKRSLIVPVGPGCYEL